MSSLGTISVDIELNGDGEFITSINKVDKVTSNITKSVDKSVKSFGSLSSVFSRASGTATTLATKLGNTRKASDSLQKSADKLNTSFELVAASSASAARGISEFSKAVTSAQKGVSEFSATVKDLGKSLQSVGSYGTKAATGIKTLGSAASKSSSQMRGFAASSEATYNSLKGWSRTTGNVTSSLSNLGASLARITGEARALRTELNSIDRLRAPNTNSLRGSVRVARAGSESNGGISHSASNAANASYASSINNVTDAINRSSSAHTGFIHSMTETAFVIDEVSQAAQLVWEIFGSWTERVVEVNAHTEKLILTLKGLSTATTDAGRQAEALDEYNQIFSMSQSAPFAIDKLSEGLVRFKSANLSQPVADLQAISDALAHFGASDQQFDSVTLAIQQMGGKGVVSMEELRRQMGEALPSAMQAMADAMNVSMAQLVKMVTSGSLESTRALQLMFDQFNRLYGGSSAQKMQTFSGQVSLLQSNMQKLALAVGGRGMDGTYGPDSSYGQLTKTIQTLNDALESPEAQEAARQLNDSLASIGRTLQSLISFSVTWGGTIVSVGSKILEAVIAIKAMNLALKGTAAAMEAVQASQFLSNSGALGALNGIGAKTTTRQTYSSLGLATGAVEETSQGYLGRASGLVNSLAEGGVGGLAGTAIAKYTASMKPFATLLNAIPVMFGAADTAALAFGATITSIALPVVAVGAALAGVLMWMNRIKDSSKITGEAIQNVLQGDTSGDSMDAARKELANSQGILDDARAKRASINNTANGSGFTATTFGSLFGNDGVKSPGSTLFGDSYLAKGSEEAVEYQKQLDNFITITESEQKRLKNLVDGASTLASDSVGKKYADQYMQAWEISRRSSEAEFTQTNQRISQERLKLSPTDVAGGQALDKQASDAVVKEDTESLRLLNVQLDDAKANFAAAFSAKDENRTRQYSKTVDVLSDNYTKLAATLRDTEERLGKPITLDSEKQSVRDQRNAGNAIVALQTKYTELTEAVKSGATSVTEFDKAQTLASKSQALDSQKTAWLDIARAVDEAEASMARFQAAQKAIAQIGESQDRSVQNIQSSILQFENPSTENERDYTNTVAKNNADARTAMENLSVNASGLDATQYQNVTTAVNQAKASYDSLADSIKTAGDQLLSAQTSLDNTGSSLSVLSTNTSSMSDKLSVAAVTLDTYTNKAYGAANATSLLGQNMNIVSKADTANMFASLDAAMRLGQRIQSQKEGLQDKLETPEQSYNRRKTERDNSVTDAIGNINSVLSDNSASGKLAQYASKTTNGDLAKATMQLTAMRDALKANNDAVDSLAQKDAFGKMARSGAPALKAVNTLKETLAGYQAELSGSSDLQGKFEQKMKDLGVSSTDAQKALAKQTYETSLLVDAQKKAIETANDLIKAGDQKGSEADSLFANLDVDPTKLSSKLATIHGRYASAIAGVQKNVNPNDGGNYSAQKQQKINGLQTADLNAQKEQLAQTVSSYAQSDRQIQESFADTLAEKRALQEKFLNDDTTDAFAAVAKQQAAGNISVADAKRVDNTIAAYHADKMKEIERQTENSLQATGREWGDSEKLISDGLNSMMSSFVDTMATQLSSGTASWKSFGQSILKIIEEIGLKLALSPLMTALGNGVAAASSGGGFLGSIGKLFGFAGGSSSSSGLSDNAGSNAFEGAGLDIDKFHSGGIVGYESGSGSKTVAANIFHAAKKYHTGGVAGGLAGDEIPAILRKGEGVFTGAQMQQIGNAYRRSASMDSVFDSMASSVGNSLKASNATPVYSGSGKSAGMPPVTMNFHNQTGSDMKATSGTPKFDGESWVIDTVIKHATKPGALRSTLGGVGK